MPEGMKFRAIEPENVSAAEKERQAIQDSQKETEEAAAAQGKTEKTDVDNKGGDNPQGGKADPQGVEINEEAALSFLNKRFGREYESLDKYNEVEKVIEKQELPEDVAKFAEYKKETGRGLKDFYMAQNSYEDASENILLSEYLKTQEDWATEEEIAKMIEKDYSFDEEVDDDDRILEIKRKKHKLLADAKNYFKEQSEKYKVPLESRADQLNAEQKASLEAYAKHIEDTTSREEAVRKKAEYFLQKTEEVFNDEFKGFEFEIGESKHIFSAGDASELMSKQIDIGNFTKKFLDPETGLIKDPVGYHKSLAAAMNPDALAKHFYELGKSHQADSSMKKMKNIDMDSQKVKDSDGGGGTKYREIKSDSDVGLRLKVKK